MTTESSEFNAVVKRLEKLERQNNWLRITCILAFVLLSAFVLVGLSGPKPTTTEAEKFILRDAQGKTRATLGFNGTGRMGLMLFDEAGKGRAGLVLPGKGIAGLILCDKDEEVLTELCVSEVGLPALILNTKGQKGRAELSLLENESPVLNFFGKDGQGQVYLCIADTGPRFVLTGKDRKTAAELGISKDGWSTLSLADSSGKTSAELRVLPKGSPSLRLLNDAGHALAELGGSGLELHDEEGNLRGKLGLIRENPGSPQQPQLMLCSKDGKPLFQAP